MRKTAIPTVYPREGAYNTPVHIILSCAEPNARIHYTLDGSEPTMESPVYEKEKGAILLEGPSGADTTHVVRAFAEADGLEPSRIVDLTYRFIMCPKSQYYHEILREPTEDTAGIIRLYDFDQEKLYLVIGTKKAILVDAGVASEGDLPGFCDELLGGAMPVELFIGHGHYDHYAQAENFVKAGKKVYMSHLDLPIMKEMGGPGSGIDPKDIMDVQDGDVFDLGNTTLRAYHFPGHSPGGMVLLDEKTGDLYASDALGHNRRYQPDALFMHFGGEECALENCLCVTEEFIARTKGKLTRFFSGHNDDVYDPNQQLEVLCKMYRKALELGEAALEPTVRRKEESFGSGTIVTWGDYRIDPIWNAANVKFIYAADAKADPPKYAKGYTPMQVLCKEKDFDENR